MFPHPLYYCPVLLLSCTPHHTSSCNFQEATAVQPCHVLLLLAGSSHVFLFQRIWMYLIHASIWEKRSRGSKLFKHKNRLQLKGQATNCCWTMLDLLISLWPSWAKTWYSRLTHPLISVLPHFSRVIHLELADSWLQVIFEFQSHLDKHCTKQGWNGYQISQLGWKIIRKGSIINPIHTLYILVVSNRVPVCIKLAKGHAIHS